MTMPPATKMPKQEPLDAEFDYQEMCHIQNKKAMQKKCCNEFEKYKQETDQKFQAVFEHIAALQSRIVELESAIASTSSAKKTKKVEKPTVTMKTEPVDEETSIETTNEACQTLFQQLSAQFESGNDLKCEVASDSSSSSSSSSSIPSTSSTSPNPITTFPSEEDALQKAINDFAAMIASNQQPPPQSLLQMTPGFVVKKEESDENMMMGGLVLNQDGTRCANCQAVRTCAWRRDAERRLVCNACGLYQRIHKANRPIEMKKDRIQRRVRQSKCFTPSPSTPLPTPAATPMTLNPTIFNDELMASILLAMFTDSTATAPAAAQE